jgi:hypothetical protein
MQQRLYSVLRWEQFWALTDNCYQLSVRVQFSLWMFADMGIASSCVIAIFDSPPNIKHLHQFATQDSWM